MRGDAPRISSGVATPSASAPRFRHEVEENVAATRLGPCPLMHEEIRHVEGELRRQRDARGIWSKRSGFRGGAQRGIAAAGPENNVAAVGKHRAQVEIG